MGLATSGTPASVAPISRRRKITKIETLVCHARMRNWIFVKVLTDQPGLWGWGEATLEWHTRGVLGAIADLEALLVGEDPTRVEHLWQKLLRSHRNFRSGGLLIHTIAELEGIDTLLAWRQGYASAALAALRDALGEPAARQPGDGAKAPLVAPA